MHEITWDDEETKVVGSLKISYRVLPLEIRLIFDLSESLHDMFKSVHFCIVDTVYPQKDKDIFNIKYSLLGGW